MSQSTYTLNVTGMTCGHCERAITRALQQLDGGAQVAIDRPNNHVEVNTTASLQEVCDAIKEEGFQPDLA